MTSLLHKKVTRSTTQTGLWWLTTHCIFKKREREKCALQSWPSICWNDRRENNSSALWWPWTYPEPVLFNTSAAPILWMPLYYSSLRNERQEVRDCGLGLWIRSTQQRGPSWNINFTVCENWITERLFWAQGHTTKSELTRAHFWIILLD